MKFTLYVLLSIPVIVWILDFYRLQDFCVGPDCRSILNALLLSWFVFSIISLFFYVILYNFLPQKYYISWWKFARYAIPTVFVFVTLINLQLHHTPGGWMNLDHAFDRLFIVALYGLFIIGSLIQLIRGYYSEYNDISSLR